MSNGIYLEHKVEFPKMFELLGKKYMIDFVGEDSDVLSVCVINKNKEIVKRFIIDKDNGYLNMIYVENILLRNFESYLYWREVKQCGDSISFDDRLAIYNKYWRKGKYLAYNKK